MGNVTLHTPISLMVRAVEFCNSVGTRVCIAAGHMDGSLRLSGFVHPVTGDDSSGPTVVEVDGRVPDGRCIQYRTVLKPNIFAPQREDFVTLNPLGVNADYCVSYPISDVERNGDLGCGVLPPVRILGKYVTATAAIWAHGTESLLVHYSINSDDPRAVRGSLRLGFELPITRLLWRKAPVISYDGWLAEAASHVDVKFF